MRHWLDRRFALLLITAGLLAGHPGAHGAPAGPLDLRYGMYWSGVRVADLELLHEEQAANGYAARLKAKATGVTELLTRYRAQARVEGTRLNGTELRPETYHYRYKSRKSRRAVEVTFDPEQGEAVAVESTKRGKPDPSDVPPELWTGVIDPLTAFLHLRRQLLAVRNGEPAQLTTQVFDGRRRYQLSVTPKGRTQAGQTPALRVELLLKPIAGFDEDDYSAEERRDGLRAEILLSDDERLVPLRMTINKAPLQIVIRLEAECSGPRACRPAQAAIAAPQSEAVG